MEPQAVVDDLRQQQCESGAFASTVHLPFGAYPDENAFVTGLVLRYLHHLPAVAGVEEMIQHACHFLRRCESSVCPGLFGFWPNDAYPFWMGKVRLHEDADDSAIVSLELVRHGQASMDYLHHLARRVLGEYRFFSSHLAASDWRRCGVFLTWIDYFTEPNPVDCCVNANVIALLATGGLMDMDGYSETCAMLNDAIQRTNSLQAAADISPYYPHPLELFFAVEHAVECGASELVPSLDHLSQQAWVQDGLQVGPASDVPICGHPENHIIWTAPAVQLLRAYRNQIDPLTIRSR